MYFLDCHSYDITQTRPLIYSLSCNPQIYIKHYRQLCKIEITALHK